MTEAKIKKLEARVEKLEGVVFAEQRFMVTTHYGGSLGTPVHPIVTQIMKFPSDMSFEECHAKALKDLNSCWEEMEFKVKKAKKVGDHWPKHNYEGTYVITNMYRIF